MRVLYWQRWAAAAKTVLLNWMVATQLRQPQPNNQMKTVALDTLITQMKVWLNLCLQTATIKMVSISSYLLDRINLERSVTNWADILFIVFAGVNVIDDSSSRSDDSSLEKPVTPIVPNDDSDSQASSNKRYKTEFPFLLVKYFNRAPQLLISNVEFSFYPKFQLQIVRLWKFWITNNRYRN